MSNVKDEIEEYNIRMRYTKCMDSLYRYSKIRKNEKRKKRLI